MKKIKVAVDFDNTLFDTNNKFKQIYIKKTGIEIPEIITFSYDYVEEICKEFKFSSMDIFRECWADCFSLIPMFECVSQIYDTLPENKYSIDVVTSGDKEFYKDIKFLLEDYDIKFDELVYEDKKEKLEYDLFIDDNPNLVPLVEAEKNKEIILFQQNWNIGVKNVVFLKKWGDQLYE